MDEGEHTYSLYGAKGDLLDSVTVTAPDCSDDGTVDPGTDEPGTDEPGDDAGTPVVTAPTPEIPKVVQTG